MFVLGFRGLQTLQATCPPLTVWTRHLEYTSKTNPGANESGFLRRTSTSSGSCLVGQPSHKLVTLFCRRLFFYICPPDVLEHPCPYCFDSSCLSLDQRHTSSGQYSQLFQIIMETCAARRSKRRDPIKC